MCLSVSGLLFWKKELKVSVKRNNEEVSRVFIFKDSCGLVERRKCFHYCYYQKNSLKLQHGNLSYEGLTSRLSYKSLFLFIEQFCVWVLIKVMIFYVGQPFWYWLPPQEHLCDFGCWFRRVISRNKLHPLFCKVPCTAINCQIFSKFQICENNLILWLMDI